MLDSTPLNPAAPDRLLGEYRLKALIAENPRSRTWLAEQVSVSRHVLLDELRPDQSQQQEAFLADVRAKAAVDHPLIGSVYEAVVEPGVCFFAHELLPGVTLLDRLQAAEPLKPVRLAHMLRHIAEAHYQHEAVGRASSPLGLEHIYLDAQGIIRLTNLAIAGQRDPEQSTRDITFLGQALPALVADGQPGSTRLFTLLGWMRGEGLEKPISWDQVRDTCSQIEQQLNEPSPPAAPTKAAARQRTKRRVIAGTIIGGLALVVIGGLAIWRRPQHAPAPPRATLPGLVSVPAGKHPTPDGTEEDLPAFRIAAHEVTIGQYAAFVETLETLTKSQRQRTFDHENQPPTKTSHLPDDWPALLAAAKTNGTWNNRAVTLDSPVVGVDWWDAAAYAEWQQARLATQEEWFAALRLDASPPANLKPAGWIPVTATTTDRTAQGLIGMAGSACEWTRRPAANPANPLGERLWVIIGGSFLKPGSNALTREWTNDRSLRRPDLGFRIVCDAQ